MRRTDAENAPRRRGVPEPSPARCSSAENASGCRSPASASLFGEQLPGIPRHLRQAGRGAAMAAQYYVPGIAGLRKRHPARLVLCQTVVGLRPPGTPTQCGRQTQAATDAPIARQRGGPVAQRARGGLRRGRWCPAPRQGPQPRRALCFRVRRAALISRSPSVGVATSAPFWEDRVRIARTAWRARANTISPISSKSVASLVGIMMLRGAHP